MDNRPNNQFTPGGNPVPPPPIPDEESTVYGGSPENAFGNQQFGQPQFGQQPYGQPDFGQPQFGQPQFGEPQFGNQQFGNPQMPKIAPPFPPSEQKKQNPLLFIGIGVGVLLLVGLVLFYVFMPRNENADEEEEVIVAEEVVTDEPLNAEMFGGPFGDGVRMDRDYSQIVCYQRLTPDDISHLSKPELRILRNTIYAHHGRRFQSRDLREYFYQFDWYSPYRNEVYPNEFSAVEKANFNLIQSYE